MNKELDFIEKDVTIIKVENNELRLTHDDLPMTIILEGRKKYILIDTPKGLVLNKKS